MRRFALIVCAAVLGACGRAEGPDDGPLERWAGGVYHLTTPSPATQACGSAQVTFTSERVALLPDDEEKAVVAYWDDSQIVGGWLDESGRFIMIWDLQRTDEIPCPGSGSSVTTTITNVWVGTPVGETIESQLFQEIEDDCTPATACSVYWELHGTRE